MAEYFLIAKVVSVEGDKGELKISPVSDYPERFKKLKKIFIDFWGEKKIFTLQYVISKGESFIFKLKDFNDKQSAQVLVGKEIFVDRKNLKKPPETHYFIHDIVGCNVIRNGCDFGEVVDVYLLKANDVFVIKKVSGEEILLPAVQQFIENVDVVNRVITLKSGDEFYEDDEN